MALLYRRHLSWRENFRRNVALFLRDPAMVDRIVADERSSEGGPSGSKRCGREGKFH